jgi:hypothetical protein
MIIVHNIEFLTTPELLNKEEYLANNSILCSQIRTKTN